MTRGLRFWTSIGLALASTAVQAEGRWEEEGTCVGCHAEERDEEMRAPVEEWRGSVHATHFVSCDGCHGGNPYEEDADLSMSEEAGFLENPSWTEESEYCGACHEAIGERYVAGRFGQAMKQGHRVPTCTTCHMPEGHDIEVATASDVAPRGACRNCLMLLDPEATADVLTRAHAAIAHAAERVDLVEALGIEQTDRRAALVQIATDLSSAAHGFDAGEIEDFAGATEEATALHARETARFEQSALDRRRYGGLVIAGLALVLISLMGYRRSLHGPQ